MKKLTTMALGLGALALTWGVGITLATRVKGDADPPNRPAGAASEAGTPKELTETSPRPVRLESEPRPTAPEQNSPEAPDRPPVNLSSTPAKDGIDVTLRQSDRALVAKFGDQFNRHPGEGFLHPQSVLAYRFVIKHSLVRPTKVWARYEMEGIDGSTVTRPNIDLLPSKLHDGIADVVDADKHELPSDKPRYLALELREESETGRLLFKRKYPFQLMMPSQYLRVQDGFDKLNNRAFIDVWHLKSDPVSGPSEVTFDIDGGQKAWTIPRGSAARLFRDYPKLPPPVDWTLQVDQVVDAFKGRIDTGFAPPEAGRKDSGR